MYARVVFKENEMVGEEKDSPVETGGSRAWSRRRVVPLLFVLLNILIGHRPRRVIYRLTMPGRLVINYVVLCYFI